MLKVKFIRYKNVVIADILEQGEEIEIGNFSFEYNGYEIASYGCLSLDEKTLYLKGIAKNLDDCKSCYGYDTEEEAEEAVKGFTAAIKAYNDTLKPEQKKQENDGVEITIAG